MERKPGKLGQLQTARKYRAAAGLSGCAILYSEDMQDGLNLQGPARAGNFTLAIRNPFSR